MADGIPDLLKSLRRYAGLSTRALALRAHVSAAAIGHIETGFRQPTVEILGPVDRALGTAPLLTMLLGLDGEETQMKRRALLTLAGAATGLAGIDGATAVADLIRHTTLDEAGVAEDWDAVVASYSRRLVTEPTPAYGAALLVQIMLLTREMADQGKTSDRLRASAHLSHLYGLWQGNQGKIATAHGWYRSAGMVAERSGDTNTRVFITARTASRGIFEGLTPREVVAGADGALAMSDRPTPGALEAHSALVHVHALTGDLEAGRRSISNMIDVAEALPDAGPAGPIARTVSFRNYLECRAGGRRDADRAWAEAEPILRPVPVWWREAQVYYGRALVTSNDIDDGIAYGLAAVKALPVDVRTVGVAVSDLLSVVPASHASDDLDELRGYAATGPAPWETLAV